MSMAVCPASASARFICSVETCLLDRMSEDEIPRPKIGVSSEESVAAVATPNELKAKVEELESNLQKKSQEVVSLNSRLSELDTIAEDLRSRITNAESSAQAKEEQLVAKTEELNAKITEADDKSRDLAALSAKVAEGEQAISRLEDRVSTATKKAESSEAELATANSELAIAQENARDKAGEIADLKRELDEAKGRVAEKDKIVADVQRVLGAGEGAGSIMSQIASLKEDVHQGESARGRIDELERALRRYKAIAQDDPTYAWIKVLDDRKSLRMRQLAMTAGTSVGKLKPLIARLSNAGLLILEDGNLDEGDPIVRLVD